MNLPDHIAALIDAAHEAHTAYIEKRGTLHDSSEATVAARSAICGWAMDVIYRREQKPLSAMFNDGDNTAEAMRYVMAQKARAEARQREEELSAQESVDLADEAEWGAA